VAVDRWLSDYRGTDGKLAPERMKEAVQAALRDSDPVRTSLFLSHLLNELTPENARAAFEAITESVRTADSARYLTLLAHAWGALDGRLALEGLESLGGRDGESAKATALAAWAAGDPEAALAWFREHAAQSDPSPNQRQERALSRGLVTGLARRDLDRALDYVMNLEEGQRSEFGHLLAEQKLRDGVVAGAEWAAQLPEEDMRTNALETVGYEYIRQDLTGATEWAERIAGRADAHEAVADVGNALALRDGQEAALWASRLPAGPSQNHAMEDIFEVWTRADPLAASQGLTRMPPGSGRDAAIQAFSRTLTRENPADAITWAGALSDPEARLDLQVEIARRWQGTAPADAQAWITGNLPPEAQARALAPSRR
jgi:hypothetical protein